MKVAIIGAGNVGSSAASILIAQKIADKIAFVDINKNLAIGKALDLNHLCAVLELDTKVKASDDYKVIKNADICVITAGLTRKEGQERKDLLEQNAKIVAHASKQIAKYAPKSVIIVVTNPLDAMTFVAHKASGFAKQKVLGMAGELDTGRLRFQIAIYCGLKNSQVGGYVLGEHGNNMVVHSAHADNEKANFDSERILENFVKKAGAEIISLLGTSAYYAPGAAIAKMCKAIKEKEGKVLICSVIGKDEIPCGLPVKFGKKIKIKKTKADLSAAKESIEQDCQIVSKMDF